MRPKYGYRRPDYQQKREYAAEHALERNGCVGRRFKNLSEIQKWSRKVICSTWFSLHVPKRWKQFSIEVRGCSAPYYQARRSRRNDTASANIWGPGDTGYVTLYLPRWAWTDVTILHELSHIAVWKRAMTCHGPTYCARRIEAQHLFGKPGSAKVLESEMRARNLDIARNLWRKA
jgi:hypothetical protein